jgi:PleD family two-component response regulator
VAWVVDFCREINNSVWHVKCIDSGQEIDMKPVQTSANSSVMPRALIIGAGPEALMGIEPMLGANRFRVDFLDRDSTPYIAIRQYRPDLVVLCFAPDDDEACQVLQMLQLDPATRRLPILTYVNGEAYAIIANQWPRPSGIPSASRSLEERCTVR